MNTPPASPEHHPIRTGPTKEERHAYNGGRGRPGTDQRLHAAGRQLYDGDCALHTAHQTHVDAWIAAANRKLAESRHGQDLRFGVESGHPQPPQPRQVDLPARTVPAQLLDPGLEAAAQAGKNISWSGIRLSYSGRHLVQCCCARRPYRFTPTTSQPVFCRWRGPAVRRRRNPGAADRMTAARRCRRGGSGCLPCPQRPHQRRTGHAPDQPAGRAPPRSWPARCRWPVSRSREARQRPRRASP